MNKLLIWSAGIATLSAFVGFTAAAIYPVATPQPEYPQPESLQPESLQPESLQPESLQPLPSSPPENPQEVSDAKPLETPNRQSNPQPPSTSSIDAYPRHPFVLEDEAEPGTDFFEFRQQLRQIVRDRDAQAIRSIALPEINLTFGPTIALDDLEIDNPDALFWQRLDRAMATGCATLPPIQPGDSLTWACPHVFAAQPSGSDFDSYTHIFIIAENVNVRAEPNLDSPVVGVVSHEIVKYDSQVPVNPSTRELGETSDGWKPIILSNGERGFVSSRYAYSPIGYRAVFVRVDGEWRMQTFIVGD